MRGSVYGRGAIAAFLFLAACGEDLPSIVEGLEVPPTLGPVRDCQRPKDAPGELAPPVFGEARSLVTLPGAYGLQQDATSLFVSVYEWNTTRARRLMRISKRTAEVVAIIDDPQFALVWSVVGSEIYFLANKDQPNGWTSFRRLPTSGGAAVELRDDEMDTFVVDEDEVFFVTSEWVNAEPDLRRASLDGGASVVIARNLPLWERTPLLNDRDRIHAIGSTITSVDKATGEVLLSVDLRSIVGITDFMLTATAQDDEFLYLGLSDYVETSIGWLVRVDKCSGDVEIVVASELTIGAIALDDGNIYWTEFYDPHCDCGDGDGEPYDPPPPETTVWRQAKTGGDAELLWRTWARYMRLAIDDSALYASDTERGIWFLPKLGTDLGPDAD